jgi:hypothetical protein
MSHKNYRVSKKLDAHAGNLALHQSETGAIVAGAILVLVERSRAVMPAAAAE